MTVLSLPFMCCATIICGLVEPSYSTDQPDTAENIKGFELHLEFAPTADVTELYYYADVLGIDGKYQLGFKADLSTIERIIAENALEQTDECEPSILATEFSWWKNSELATQESCWITIKENSTQRLWYDEQTRQAWYLDYDK